MNITDNVCVHSKAQILFSVRSAVFYMNTVDPWLSDSRNYVGGTNYFTHVTRLTLSQIEMGIKTASYFLDQWKELLVQDLTVVLKTALFAASTFVHCMGLLEALQLTGLFTYLTRFTR